MQVEVCPKILMSRANERIYLDISSIKAPKDLKVNVTKPYWRLMVDERTRMKWSAFFEHKNDMIEPRCEIFNRWKQAGQPVQYVRCDNAGENLGLENRLKSSDWKLAMDFE